MALLALCHISLWDDQGIKINDIFEDPQNGPAWLSVRDCCLLVFLNTAFTFKVVTVHRRHVRQELSLDRHFKITYWMNCTHVHDCDFSELCFFPFKHQEAKKYQNQDNDDLYNGGCPFIENCPLSNAMHDDSSLN